jgi:DNA-binding NtrC family response regulator
MTRVLIVDDDPLQLRLTAEVASRAGFSALTVDSGEKALEALREDPGLGAVVPDLVMPDLDGMAVMEAMRRDGLNVPVIAATASSSLETVVTAMRQGAIDFIVKPASPERLLVSLTNALRIGRLETSVRGALPRRATIALSDIVTNSPIMDRVQALAAKAAKTTMPVLIEGEAGTGKEMLARAIHAMGERAGKPFVTLDCASLLPEELQRALFGRLGKLLEAHGGTLFLAEIGALSDDLQAQLGYVLQHGRIEATGERVNVRIIAATRSRLLNLAQAGTFREDLYYRLNVFPIYMPPLRDRRGDIAALTAHFVTALAAEAGRRITGLTPAVLDLLESYDWPGNIGQLETMLYRAIMLCGTAELDVCDFPQILARTVGRDEALRLAEAGIVTLAPRHIDAAPPVTDNEPPAGGFVTAAGEISPLADMEKALISTALDHYAGHMSKAARALGIGRSTLYRKLKEYGLDTGLASDAA